MNRYSRNAKAASVTCITCNAPAVTTVDNTYVCVECGRSPITPRGSTMRVERDGITVTKSISSNGKDYDEVSLAVSSSLPHAADVRISDPLGDRNESPGVRFSTPAENGSLDRTRKGVEFRGVVPPGQTIEAEYRVHSGSTAGTERLSVDAVDPLEPSADAVTGDRLMADGSDVLVEGDQSVVTAASITDAETTPTDGATTGVQPPEPSEVAVDDREGRGRQPTSGDEAGPLADGLLVTPDSDIEPVISVVLPTKDEEGGIQECIDRIRSALRALNLPGEIIVSDSSTDRTPAIARENGAHVVTPDRDGYGYAYRYAFEHARGDFIVIGDADTTYDFEELPKLFELVEDGADMAIGSRLAGEIKPGAMPALHRYVGNPVLTKFLNVFYDAGVSDAHSGFRVIRRDALDRMTLRSDGMEFASEMVMEAGAKGLRIDEVPITYHERVGEATLDSFRDGWRHVKFMLTNAPAYIFAAPALVLSMIGLVTMLLSVTESRLFGLYFGIQTAIAGSLLTIVGYQIGSLAIFSAIAGDPIRKQRDVITDWVTESFRLEHGAVAGSLLFGIGMLYVVTVVYQWISSGTTVLPNIKWNIVAFTLIVLGIQTVFYSFFLSLIGQATNSQ